MTIKIPDLKTPTAEEMREGSIRWYDRQKGTLLDELPPDVLAMSVETKFFEFDVQAFLDVFDGNPIAKNIDEIALDIDRYTGWDNRFFKLNSRSPKDAAAGASPLTCSAKHALWHFFGSGRIMDDLCQFRHILDIATPKICVRKPFYGLNGFGTWEFRCFVKDGDLIAVTDYDYHRPNPHMKKTEVRAEYRQKIDDFFADIHPRMDISTYVFEVVFTWDGPLLIEVNPYGLSDPCFLVSYDGVDGFSGDIAFEMPIDND